VGSDVRDDVPLAGTQCGTSSAGSEFGMEPESDCSAFTFDVPFVLLDEGGSGIGAKLGSRHFQVTGETFYARTRQQPGPLFGLKLLWRVWPVSWRHGCR
jgi:hypothetical protein